MAKKNRVPEHRVIPDQTRCLCFLSGGSQERKFRWVTLGSPLEGGALFSEERKRQVLGAVHLRLVGLVRMGKTSRVQVWCAGHLHPSLKNKNKNQKRNTTTV